MKISTRLIGTFIATLTVVANSYFIPRSALSTEYSSAGHSQELRGSSVDLSDIGNRVRGMFCNTFGFTGWNGVYDLKKINFLDDCAECSNTSIKCLADKVYIEAEAEKNGNNSFFLNPLCCAVKPLCSCPSGMVGASCGMSAMKHAVPIFSLFADDYVSWVDAWQQYATNAIHILTINAIGFARVLTDLGREYFVREIMTARQVLEEAWLPVSKLGLGVASLDEVIHTCKTFLDLTAPLERFIDHWPFLANVKMIWLTRWDAKADRWRDTVTGRFSKNPWITVVKERIREFISDKAESVIIELVERYKALHPQSLEFLFGVSRLLRSTGDTAEQVAMVISGSRYVAASVKNYASKLRTVAASANTAQSLEALSGALDVLVAGAAIFEIAQGFYRDSHATCGCCVVSDTALISFDLSPHARTVASELRHQTFEITFPEYPWRALDAAKESFRCFSQLVFSSNSQNETILGKVQEAVLAGIRERNLHGLYCLDTALSILVPWSEQEVVHQRNAAQEIMKQMDGLFDDIQSLKKEVETQRQAYETATEDLKTHCLKECAICYGVGPLLETKTECYQDWVNPLCWLLQNWDCDHKWAKLNSLSEKWFDNKKKLNRLNEEFDVLGKVCKSEREHVQGARAFFQDLWALSLTQIAVQRTPESKAQTPSIGLSLREVVGQVAFEIAALELSPCRIFQDLSGPRTV